MFHVANARQNPAPFQHCALDFSQSKLMSYIYMKLRQLLVFAALLCISAFSVKAASSELLTRALIPAADQPVEAVLAGMSGTGRWVAFLSKADGLVTNRHNASVWDVFVKDRQTDLVQLVSVNITGTNGANADCDEVSISQDGRWVVFTSAASNLIPNDTNSQRDVFARDLVAGTTFLVSGNPDGSVANGSASNPWPTPDFRFVVFLSTGNPVAGIMDTNGLPDIFIRNLILQKTEAITVDYLGNSTAFDRLNSSLPVMGESPQIVGVSDSGRRVAFISGSPRLNADFATTQQVLQRLYVRDVPEQTNMLASIFPLGTSGYDVHQAFFSANGFTVSFSSLGFRNTAPVVAWRNLTESESIKLILPSRSFSTLIDFQMSSDAEWLTFQFRDKTGLWLYRRSDQSSTFLSNNLAVGPIVHHKWQGNALFRSRATLTSNTTNVTVGSGEVLVRDFESPGEVVFSTDGSFAVYETNRQGRIEIRTSGEDGDHPLLVLESGPMYLGGDAPVMTLPLSLSADGRFVLYSSMASNLTGSDTNGWGDFFVYDSLVGSNILVTVGIDGQPASGQHQSGCLSTDGRKVLFISSATNLVVNDTNGWPDVFLRDIVAGTTRKLTGKFSVPVVQTPALVRWAPYLSPDGRYAGFSSSIHDMIEGDASTVPALFVQDLQTEGVWLVASNGLSPSFAFETLSVTSGPIVTYAGYTGSSTTRSRTIFRADLAQGKTEAILETQSYPLASANGMTVAGRGQVTNNVTTISAILWTNLAGTSGSFPSTVVPGFDKTGQRLQLTRDGRWLIFTTAEALVPEDLNTNLDVYVEDITTTNAPVWVSQTEDGRNLDGDCLWPCASQDGSWVAFRRSLPSPRQFDLYLRNIRGNKLLKITQQTSSNHDLLGGLTPTISDDGNFMVAGDFISTESMENTPINLFAFLAAAEGSDSDKDGLPDDWEMANFGNLGEDGAGDADGDGASNLLEWKTGTDPKSAQSRLGLNFAVSTNPTSLILTWSVPPGQNWSLERSPTFLPTVWTTISNPLRQGPGPNDWRFEAFEEGGSSFFRLVAKP